MLSIKTKWFPRLPSRGSFLPMYEDEQGEHLDDVAAPMVPPPIVSSVVLPREETSMVSATGSTTIYAPDLMQLAQPDWLVLIDRKEKHLQQQLQFLLDAQADGLLAGLEGANMEDGSSEGSVTTTRQSMRRDGPTPVRQPIPRKVGLRGARRGIYNTINELAALKTEQIDGIEDDIAGTEDVLRQIVDWEQKGEGLRNEIEGVEHSPEGSGARQLEQEAETLQGQIDTLELRLSEMKGRHRALTHQLSVVESSVQSKLSSYKASLSLLDAQIQTFLRRPPLRLRVSALQYPSFANLPPNRRTLSIAKEHFLDLNQASKNQLKEVKIEREALEGGAVVWKEVISEVTEFEQRLRQSLKESARNTPGLISQKQTSGITMSSTGMEDMIAMLDRIISQVEDKYSLAQAREWKLLVCSIGAELVTLKQGKEILAIALGATNGTDDDDLTAATANGTEAHDFAASTPHTGSPGRGGSTHFESDEEPDPELLLSHQDTDTE